ncbi:MAG TPA: hypothetical protein PK677_15045 [Acidiphilium sp.]|nr:hypothetical protein [Acidiphilium sp.]
MIPEKMISPAVATQLGWLPIRNAPVRFSVGSPDGITSNSWKVWATRSGVYIACRDNFKETKVSLHISSNPSYPNRWRVGFTTESLPMIAHLRSSDENRAWDVWNEPEPTLPNTIVAFRLYFLTTELAVELEKRDPKKWKDVIYIESAPPGKLTVLTLFITIGEPNLNHESEPSFRLASFDIGNGRYAQLIAHGEPATYFPDLVKDTVAQAIAQAASAGVNLPEQSYGYFLGRHEDGCRYIFGAHVSRPQT